VREAFASGYEVDEEGDAFFYAFTSAGTAVAAVEQAMRGLERGPIRIRVGMHTGEPVLDPPRYVGWMCTAPRESWRQPTALRCC
jgi:class 3 adenylate cyclase